MNINPVDSDDGSDEASSQWKVRHGVLPVFPRAARDHDDQFIGRLPDGHVKLWSLINLDIRDPLRPGARHQHGAKIGSGRLGRFDLGSNSLRLLLTPTQISVDRLGVAQVVADWSAGARLPGSERSGSFSSI